MAWKSFVLFIKKYPEHKIIIIIINFWNSEKLYGLQHRPVWVVSLPLHLFDEFNGFLVDGFLHLLHAAGELITAHLEEHLYLVHLRVQLNHVLDIVYQLLISEVVHYLLNIDLVVAVNLQLLWGVRTFTLVISICYLAPLILLGGIGLVITVRLLVLGLANLIIFRFVSVGFGVGLRPLAWGCVLAAGR